MSSSWSTVGLGGRGFVVPGWMCWPQGCVHETDAGAWRRAEAAERPTC